MGFQFDEQNFIAGLIAGWGSAYMVYRSRHAIGRFRSSVGNRAETAQEFAGGRTESRYIEHLVEQCQRAHLLGDRIELSKIAVEPRFIARETFAEPPDEESIYDVFRVVPRIYDLPYLYAPYNIASAGIYDLSFGDRAIALLGTPGSGRTTALQNIALWALGKVNFKIENDSVARQLEEEEKSLKADERKRRKKEREDIEKRARERFAVEQGTQLDTSGVGAVSPFRALLPVYVNVANITPNRAEFGSDADPAEPFIRAIQYQVGGALAKTLPRRFYDLLAQGKLLVLLDGLDELPAQEQPRIVSWLKAFVEIYRQNFIIVTGPAVGYGKLMQAGLTPVFMRAYTDVQSERAVDLIAENWGIISGARQRDAQPAEPAIVRALKNDLRGLSPLEITLKARAYFAQLADDDDPLAQMVALYVAERELPKETLERLPEVAALQLDEGFITLQRLRDLALGVKPVAVQQLPPEALQAMFTGSGGADEDTRALDAIFGDDAEGFPPPPASARPAPAGLADGIDPTEGMDKKELAALEKAQEDLVQSLISAGILKSYRRGRYLFAYPVVASYFASQLLHTASDDYLIEKGLLPAWDEALALFHATHSADVAVRARFNQLPDALYHHLLGVARWMAHSPVAPGWRAEALKRLGSEFIAPNQYPYLRERVASALVGTRDKGALAIFKRGLTDPNPEVRRLSCLAVGALREPKAVSFIEPLLHDRDEEVKLAAGVALGAIGTEEAFDTMANVLATESEHLRQVIAETFAAMPEEGYPLLYEAIHSEEMILRRVAVFGLRRVPATWPLGEIYRVFLNDDQWYVRSAAQQVFQEIQDNDASRGLRPYPKLESVGWLREWIANLGEQAGEFTPDDALLQVIQDQDPVLKATAVQALAQLGKAEQVVYVYEALLQPEAEVRAAAQKALCLLQMQIGEGLPAPA